MNDQEMNKNGIAYLFAFVLIFLFYRLPGYHSILLFLIITYFIIADFGIAKEIKNRSLRRPVPTLKVMVIFFGTFLLLFSTALLFASSDMNIMIGFLLIVHITLSSVISILVFLINPVFDFQKKRILRKAALKMNSLKKIRTIGISGSYGKTSTKEFLYAILSAKYKVLKTEGNNNTNIGVARTILNKASDNYDYFICEMGAYKIGEIKEMCQIARPEIGILTGINEQHVELFGGMENTIKAKFELIESLPEWGCAFVNSKIKDHISKIKPKVVTYFSPKETYKIKIYQDHLEFEYEGTKFRANLLGRHYIENLISAIMVAECFGIPFEDIKNSVAGIKPNEYMMRKSTGINGSVFIDDNYSANPDGVMAALDYLKEAYPNYKKIIVFPGIIELGEKSAKVHKALFKKIDEVCEIAYILNTRLSMLHAVGRCKFFFENDFTKAANLLKKDLDKNTVVLFESRGAGVVMRKINKHDISR